MKSVALCTSAAGDPNRFASIVLFPSVRMDVYNLTVQAEALYTTVHKIISHIFQESHLPDKDRLQAPESLRLFRQGLHKFATFRPCGV